MSKNKRSAEQAELSLEPTNDALERIAKSIESRSHHSGETSVIQQLEHVASAISNVEVPDLGVLVDCFRKPYHHEITVVSQLGNISTQLGHVAVAVSAIADTLPELSHCFQDSTHPHNTVLGVLLRIATGLEDLEEASHTDTNFPLVVDEGTEEQITVRHASLDWTVCTLKRVLTCKRECATSKLFISCGRDAVPHIPLDDDARTLRSYGVCVQDLIVSAK